TAQKIDNPYSKTETLINIARVYKKLNIWKPMLEIRHKCPTKECEVDILTLALTVWAEKQNTAIADRKN
ncbi:MAG: hypothetical protein ACFBSE_22960, partial [Prochloraceae cyanobacterium]